MKLKTLLTLTSIFGSAMIIGTLFKLMHWPGGLFITIISYTVMAVVFPMLVLAIAKHPRLKEYME